MPCIGWTKTCAAWCSCFTSAEPIYQPACSPDGEEVAFVLAAGDSWRIYLLDVATGQVRP